MRNRTEYAIRLGETVNIIENIFEKRLRLVYTGKLSDETYSIAVIRTFGNNSYGYSIYFSPQQEEILLPAGLIRIIDAQPDLLQFIYERE